MAENRTRGVNLLCYLLSGADVTHVLHSSNPLIAESVSGSTASALNTKRSLPLVSLLNDFVQLHECCNITVCIHFFLDNDVFR